MIIYRSIKTNNLTQDLGESKSCAKLGADGKTVRPFQIVTKRTTCPIGYTDFYAAIGLTKGHNGKDWSAWHGEPAYHNADFDGWLRAEYDFDGGMGTDVVSNEPLLECNDGCPKGTKHYVKIRKWHGMKTKGYDKMPVKMGDEVMLCDNTGASSGDHLHEAPKWCAENGNGIHSDNGAQGAILSHPDIVYENKFVLDVINEEIKRKAEGLQRQVEEVRIKEEIRVQQLTLLDAIRKYVLLIQIQVNALIKNK